MYDPTPTIISQYATGPTTRALIDAMNQWIDPGKSIDDFYDLVWNVGTAVGYGLDVWGRIVGVGRVLQVVGTGKFWGFAQAGNVSVGTFGQSPFYSGQQITNNFIIADDGFRTLILAKAAANISNGSIPAINQILRLLFPGRGDCYVLDGLDMTMTYVFKFRLTPVEAAIVGQSGVLPRMAGVAALVTQNP
jgi:hypothetical protein